MNREESLVCMGLTAGVVFKFENNWMVELIFDYFRELMAPTKRTIDRLGEKKMS